ncbi:MAG: adenylyltransferase/cytidyltransferase family protein [Candidatus Doudnabacteria bacterium]|nr:adenylyltransferase/cytidyltransferase family protein [Candidatus Doudnabacteria bacterium]
MTKAASKRKLKKVMVFGTFDILHPGHLSFLKQASKLGNFLVVSVARDANTKKFKGFTPAFSQDDRRRMVASVKFVDKAVLGGKKNYLPHVLSERPDIIALGFDQKAYLPQLYADLESKRLKVRIVKLRSYAPAKYKSSRYKMKIKESKT